MTGNIVIPGVDIPLPDDSKEVFWVELESPLELTPVSYGVPRCLYESKDDGKIKTEFGWIYGYEKTTSQGHYDLRPKFESSVMTLCLTEEMRDLLHEGVEYSITMAFICSYGSITFLTIGDSSIDYSGGVLNDVQGFHCPSEYGVGGPVYISKIAILNLY